MSRLMGLILVLMLVMAGQSSHAQMPAPMHGGFGMDYAQPIPSNSDILDRWWMVESTPSIGHAVVPPPRTVEPPATVQPANSRRASRAVRTGHSLSRVGRRTYTRGGAAAAAPLPTGSLYWPAGSGMPLYSPAQRYGAYGQGYGVSPYGTADYGLLYKGMYWGR